MNDTEARTRLQGLLHGLDDTLGVLQHPDNRPSTERDGQDRTNPHDGAADLTDIARRDAVLAQARSQREEVLGALSRLDDGSYGRCVVCGDPLPEERLQARPEAARCVRDQAKLEQRV